jgi:hypothetical protein
MANLLSAVEHTFSDAGWAFHKVDEREVLEADFEAHHTRVRVHVQAFAEIGAISVGANLTHKVPQSRAGVISEMLMRTNEELTLGNFELLWDTGAILFRVTNVIGHREATAADRQIIASLVHSAIAEVDRLTPFVSLVLGMTTAELANLNLKTFLMREDLLPPLPDGEEQSDESNPL